jgi:methylenetetrahydrofolate dehydrogenase (NADP+)/methenyltetrahydrofolate cyclohydrolase/formyltetrahydrofolate synthetase
MQGVQSTGQAKVIDGTAIAQYVSPDPCRFESNRDHVDSSSFCPLCRQIRSDLAEEIKSLTSTYPSFKPPHLQILQLGASPASSTYIRMKQKAALESGMTVEHLSIPQGPDGVQEIEKLVHHANGSPRVNGLLVQLPLEGASPEEERRVVESVGVGKDVDGFHPENIGHLSSRLSTPLFTPCTPAGVIRLIDSSESQSLSLCTRLALPCVYSLAQTLFFSFAQTAGVQIQGANAVVLGRSDIVGTPVCALLRRRDATVTQCHSRTKGLENIVRLSFSRGGSAFEGKLKTDLLLHFHFVSRTGHSSRRLISS